MKKPSAVLLVLSLAVLALALVPAAGLAAKGGGGGKPGGGGGGKPGGGGGGGSCAPAAPGVAIDNNYGWSQWGSWGTRGQQLAYLVKVMNNDVGCGSSSFALSLSAPSEYTVSPSANTVTVGSSSMAYVWVNVTSPASTADGDHPVTATLTRVGEASPSSSFTSYYKVYSTDTTAPTLFWWTPGEGTVVTGRSYDVAVSSKDDHSVRTIELSMDDSAYVAATTCDNVTYICELHYTWSVGAPGTHTATFRSTDWMGNVGVQTVTFTVG
jgi:hypothetical protein